PLFAIILNSRHVEWLLSHAGHINHSIFWKNLAPISEGGGEPPHGSLGWAIDTNFGSLESLIQKMNAEGAALQGSVINGLHPYLLTLTFIFLTVAWTGQGVEEACGRNHYKSDYGLWKLYDVKGLRITFQAYDDPLVTNGPNLVPLLGIDVWEHAYYLQ
ncbi:hypothetical protein Gorai_012971, partial [Gossypium raimondii]|nr:hypothetical protein [Gossypium raimondii]